GGRKGRGGRGPPGQPHLRGLPQADRGPAGGVSEEDGRADAGAGGQEDGVPGDALPRDRGALPHAGRAAPARRGHQLRGQRGRGGRGLPPHHALGGPPG
ncbi:unnamed protein product, partial [Heterosigma akashiwo]